MLTARFKIEALTIQINRSFKMSSEIIVRNSTPVVSSRLIAEKVGIQHRSLARTLQNLEDDLKEYGEIIFSPYKEGKNYHHEYFVNRKQFIYLVAALRGTPQVKELKHRMVKQFIEMEEKLKNQVVPIDPQWVDVRASGKVTRRNTTDIIKEFVNYATTQGSSSAHMYYTNISKMQNKALFFVTQKYKNLRDMLDIYQLGLLAVADTIVAKAIHEGMESGLHYKDIYKLAKERIEGLVLSHGITVVNPIGSSVKESLTA